MNLTVLIGSCDSYSHLWKNFDILFQRYWHLPTKNIIVSETKTFNNDHYQTVTPGKSSWGERILKSLDLIETEYTFFILDDYYLTEHFTQEFIDNHISILEDYNAVKIMIDIDYGEPIYYLDHINEDLYKFKMTSNYLNSIQPAIWKTEYLKKVINTNYSPWDFELIGNDYTKTINPTILLKARPEHMYFNMVRSGGRLSNGWENLFLKENLNID
jgi:hypothetical protein